MTTGRRTVALIVAALLAAACAPTALDYARARHPSCRVDPVEDRGDAVVVRVACPGAAPVERTYRAQ